MHTASKETGVRYHALDALRAWAMLLGIVLHAAWLMTSQNLLAPMTDVDGGLLYDFLLNTIHIFRLQVFFVMAGFFAHLVLKRRGTSQFVRHRLERIALPLFIFWLILYPIITFLYTESGLQTGQLLSDRGLWETFLARLRADVSFNPTNPYHLWFLYYLLLIYAMLLFARYLAHKGIDRKGGLRRRMDRLFHWCLESPWGLLLLVALSTLPLYFEPLWNGLGGFVFYFVPGVAGILGYLLFFTVGWYLFSHPEMLNRMADRWARHLCCGLALSLPLFAVTAYTNVYATPLHPMMLLENHIIDHQPLVARDGTGGRGIVQQRAWERLSEKRRRFLLEHEELTTDQKAGLALELTTRIILVRRFSDPAYWEGVQLPDELRNEVLETWTSPAVLSHAFVNRHLLEFAFPDAIRTKFMDRPYARALKVGSSAVYSLSMWLCVFGLIGWFHRFFNNPTPTSRYIADSAYWIYLVHLPIMMYVQTFVGRSQWGLAGIPKFLFYIATTTVLCFVTYHYLVRSTLIGRLLNGRRFPFVAWFGKK